MRNLVLCLLLLAIHPDCVHAQSVPDETSQGDDSITETNLRAALDRAEATRDKAALNPLVNLHSFYKRHGFWHKDAAVLKDILSFWSSNVGADSLGIAQYSDQLGNALVQSADYPAAEVAFRSAIRILEDNGATYAEAANHVKRRLVHVLTKEGKTEDAEQLSAALPPTPPKSDKLETPGTHSPELVSKIEPKYSNDARKMKVSGEVKLSLIVDETGHPQQVQIVEPLGLGLDENAVAAVQAWVFKPGTRDGHPVRVHAMVEVSFRLL